jgi:hypothetical protein
MIGPSTKYFWGKQMEEEKIKLRWLNCVKNDVKSMGVKRWRKKAEDRSVRAVVLKETLPGTYANSKKDEGETEDLHVV